MRKTGAHIKPLYVEMPFCCVLPDCLRNNIKSLLKEEEAAKKAAEELSKQSAPAGPIWRRILGGAFRFAGSALKKRFGLDDAMFHELGRYFDLLARNKENEIRREREKLNIKQQETLKRVVDRKTAVEHALTCFERVQLELKQKFPEGDLSHER